MRCNTLRRSVFNFDAWHLVLAGLGTAGVALARTYPQLKEVKRDVGDLFLESIPPALEKARVTSSASEAKYVSRPDVEAKISNFLDSDCTKYCVVYGAKGVGKSEVVDHTAIGRRSVVKVPVTTIGTREELVALIMSKLTGKKISLDIDKLIEILKKCKTDGFIPTIIFDVERASSSSHERTAVLQDVRSLAKALIGYCRSIIVLSEANAVLELGKDKSREKFIFVDEMAESEARQFLKVRGANFSDKEMRYIFDSIGTSPVVLIDLMSEIPKIPLHDFVEKVLGDADQDLVDFSLKPILSALKEHPEGISVETPDKIKSDRLLNDSSSRPMRNALL